MWFKVSESDGLRCFTCTLASDKSSCYSIACGSGSTYCSVSINLDYKFDFK